MTNQPVPLHLDFHLLDRQIVDRDGALVGNVDDLELEPAPDGPRVVALLTGQRVLGQRLGGALGRWLTAAGERLATTAPLRIPYQLVAAVGSEVTLTVRQELLAEPPLEAWLREHLIDRIPGAGHARQ